MCECGIWFMEVDISVMKEKLVFKAVASKVALNPIINNKYTIALAIVYPHPTLEDDVANENLYITDQNPVLAAMSWLNI